MKSRKMFGCTFLPQAAVQGGVMSYGGRGVAKWAVGVP